MEIFLAVVNLEFLINFKIKKIAFILNSSVLALFNHNFEIMKINLLILLLFPIICFSQKESNNALSPTKPSTTDCPTWDNKSKTRSKADYYRSLRSIKPMKNQETKANDSPNNLSGTSTKKAEVQNSSSSKKEDPDNSIVEGSKIKKNTNNSEETNDSKIKTKEKSDKEKDKIEKKPKRLPSRNTTRAPKHNSNKCPQF